MGGVKIPLQDFALKMQGGLMREEGRICRTLRYIPQEILWKMFCMGSSPYKTIVSALDSMASHDIKLISIFPSQVLTESKFGNAQW